MGLYRRELLRMAGLGFSSIVLPSRTEFWVSDIQKKFPVKLSSNENPYGPSLQAQKAMHAQIASGNRYPWDLTSQLIDALAAHHHISPDNLLIGAGSTEMLDIVGRYAAREPGELVLPSPTYDYWTTATTKLGLKNISVPVTAEKKIDLKAMLNAINGNTRLIYICNPNNPTGTIAKREELIDFIDRVSKKTLVLIDEAYMDYAGKNSLLSIADKYSNLVIVKTFSKIYGMAGCRIGYAIANQTLLRNIENLQSMPNGGVSGMSVAGAMASLKDQVFINSCLIKNENVKAYTVKELENLQMKCIPSHTNFIYFSLLKYPHDYFEKLKSSDIIGTKIYEEDGKWTRITVGTDEEMRYFIQSLQKVK